MGLGYLADVLKVPVPDELRHALGEDVGILDAEEFMSHFGEIGARSPRPATVRMLATCQRAERAAARIARAPSRPLPVVDWRRVHRRGLLAAAIPVPPGLDVARVAWLDLKLPPRRLPLPIAARYTLQTPEGIVAEAMQRSRLRYRQQSLSFALSAPYLVLHAVTGLSLSASFATNAWSIPRRCAAIQYRWRQ